MTLVVLAGQSNALGWTEISALEPDLRGPQLQVRIWNAQVRAFEVMEAGRNTGDVDQPQQAGPEVAFAYAWVKAHPGETLYIVKSAQTSTGLAADPAEPDWSPSSGELFAATTARVNAAEVASGQTVSAILWMQGEHDAGNWLKANPYQANLTDIFAAMRRDWGDARTPIVFGRIRDAGEPFAQMVRDAQDAADRDDPLALDVDTDGFSVRTDNIHYDTAGLAALGRAFWGGYHALAAGDSSAFLVTAFANILRLTAPSGDALAFQNSLAAQINAGQLSQGQAVALVAARAGATTSVTTLAYEFFTGRIPTAAGVDYLVSPTGSNGLNLNSAYYQSFNLENRYINFAVNLGKLGDGMEGFTAQYGSLSLLDATRKAYTTIFGGAPSDSKAHALIDGRADYFAAYGGDGPAGIGTKAAMVGWLLAEAVKADVGVYARSNDAFLTDLADGAAFAVDLVGVYAQPAFSYTPA